MSPTSKGNALKLASAAHDLGGEAVRGTLAQNEAGRWTIGYIEIESWLSRHAGQEIVLAVAAIEAEAPAAYVRTCRTCGREYEGPSCPHCEAIRSRLRR
jgi:hypothetical protein